MKILRSVAVALLLTVSVAGCHGPQRMTRGLDEFANQGYVDSPWLYGNLLTHALLGAASGLTWVVDSFINVYYFWVNDAEPFGSGSGTAYLYKQITPAKK